MSHSKIAIVGSGIVGTTAAYLMSRAGLDVCVFEKGPDYPYPAHEPFVAEVLNRQYRSRTPPSIHRRYSAMTMAPTGSKYQVRPDVRGLELTGDYTSDLDAERIMVAGGQATRWAGMTLRLGPADFRTKSAFKFGQDWPITYEELEPYYCKAESYLGVSGTDSDNPFAPPRSAPFPMPEFELGYEDTILAERLRARGLVLHTTPQARTRRAYESRPACVNYNACRMCPIGARYQPGYHLQQATASGGCRLITNASVKRIVPGKAGRPSSVIFHRGQSSREEEHTADVVIVAAGAIESTRLLLLSQGPGHPNGLGNEGEQLGRRFAMHHLWRSELQYDSDMFPGRAGPSTGQSMQFVSPETRGRHGGVKIEFGGHTRPTGRAATRAASGDDVLRMLESIRKRRALVIHAEASAAHKTIALSSRKDRFGSPLAHVHYELDEFDHATYEFGGKLVRRYAEATQASDTTVPPIERFWSGHHHMGGSSMASDPRSGVCDGYGRVFGTDNVFVMGGALFPGSGAVNPTLTMVALAIRASERVIESQR